MKNNYPVNRDDEGNRYPTPEVDKPSLDELEYMVYDGVAQATDGCEIEPDGVCEHGHPSWLIRLGFI